MYVERVHTVHGGVKNARIHKWKTFIYFIYVTVFGIVVVAVEIYRKRVPQNRIVVAQF